MKSLRKMTSTIIAVFLGLLVIATSNQVFAQGGLWETKAPMPTARSGAAGGVINGMLYVAGGQGADGQKLTTLEVYDPARDTWTTKASMPTARNSAGGGVINGKLYVVGGQGTVNNQKLTSLEVYDPARDTWTTLAPMLNPRSGPGVVAIDDKLYVAGGCEGMCAPTTGALEVYDPTSNTWTTLAPMPTARGIADVAVVNGLFYVMGGCCGSTGPQSELMAKTIEVYNPTDYTWTAKTQHLVGAGDTAGSINGKIYLAKDADTEVCDPATDTWASLSPMAIPRYYAAGGVINGKLYVAGGLNGSNTYATLEAFTPDPPKASISGTIYNTESPSSRLPEVGVELLPPNGQGGLGFCSDPDGNFTLSNIPDGNYIVSAGGWSCGSDPSAVVYARTLYSTQGGSFLGTNDPAQAEVFSVAQGTEAITGINFYLVQGATVSGLLTAGGVGLANVPVNINGPGWGYGECTDANGDYTIKGIIPGTDYRISAGGYSCNNGPIYVQVYLGVNNTTPDWNSAKLFTLVSGQPETQSNISFFNLAPAAIIAGRVTNGTTGVANVDVGYCDLSGRWINGTRTGNDGNYTLAAVEGTWKIMFNPWAAGGNYLQQWYNNQSSASAADPVTVTPGDTANNINAVLVTGVGISGRVTNSVGAGIADVDVWAEDLNGNWIGGTGTNSQGDYTFSVAPGTYTVVFNPNRPNQAGGYYLSEWYDNQPSRNTRNFITVASGNTTINAQLETGGAISGTVTDTLNNRIANADVGYCDLSGAWINGTRTDSYGNYTLYAPAGNWKIMFNPWAAGGNYVSEWYNNKNSSGIANPVSVTAGITTSDINAQLDIGATVSGNVTGTNGAAMANVQVNVNNSTNGYGTCTKTDGSYTITGITPGTDYRVSAGGNTNCPGGVYYSQIYYDNKTDWSSADLISMNSGQSLTIDFAGLVQAAAISGNLLGDTDIGVQGLNVVLHDSQGLINYSTTGQKGGFFFGNLVAGSYTIKVYDPFLNYRYAEQAVQVSSGTVIHPNITLTKLTPSGSNLPSFKSTPQVFVYRNPGDNQEYVNLTTEIDDPSGCQPPSIKSVTVVDPAGQLHYLYHDKYQALVDRGTPYAEAWNSTRDNALSNFPTLVGNYTFTILDMDGNRLSQTVSLGSYTPNKLSIPTLSSPANLAQVDPNNLTLTWVSNAAASYQVRIYEMGERIFKENTTATSYTIRTGILAPGRWYSWQVIAMDNTNSDLVDYRSNSSTRDFFTIDGATPSPQQLTVNIVPWVSGSPLIPHDVYANRIATLKAVVKGGAPPYTYTWDFGDSTSQSYPETVSRNLEAKHQYTASATNLFNAQITVTDSVGSSVSAIYPVKLWVNPSRGVEVNVAIDDALWWLHKNLVFFTSNGIDYGMLSRGNYPAGTTAMALQAWVLNGHKPNGDANNPYTESALRARNYILSQILPICIAPETIAGTTGARNPDSNGNGKGLYVKNGHRLYETGLVLMALSTLKDPNLVETVQDLVDYLAYAQVEPDAGGGRGGWRYDTNYRESDMSVTQFPLLGLEAAEYHMKTKGVTIPLYVKEEIKNNFLYFVQNKGQGGSNFGGFGYSGPNSWVNVAKTGAGLMGLALNGFPFSDPRVTSALQFIDEHWYQAVEDPTGNNQAYNIGDLYAMYAVMKGMKSFEMRGADTTHIGGHDWYGEYAQWEIQNQQDNGTWQSPVNSYGPYVDTAFGVLLLLPQVFDIGPTAVAQASPTQVETYQPVTFSHSGSFHRDNSKSIVSYAWDFNGDGIADWTTTSLTATRTHAYTAAGTYTAILKVTDSIDQTATDQVTIVVTQSTMVPVTIKIEPETFNLGAKGVFTASITLSENSSYSLSNIDTSSLRCEGAPVVNTNLAAKKLIAKFNVEDLKGVTAGDKVTFTVTGNFKDGRPFKGSDTVRVLSKK